MLGTFFKAICFILFFSATPYLKSQYQHENWHFGPTNKGLNFDWDAGNIVAVTSDSHVPYSTAGCSVANDDRSGELLFYTDGRVVVDVDNEVMPNGGSLFGANATGNSGDMCQVPGNCDQWYVFSISTSWETMSSGNLYYSVVDLSLPGNGTIIDPQGDVVEDSKNTLLKLDVTEGMEIVNDPESHNSWLVVGTETGSSLTVYKISPDGIEYHEVFDLGESITNVSTMRFSKTGDKLVILSLTENEPVLLIDFDPISGNMTEVSEMEGTPIGLGALAWTGMLDAEFSSDGTKLYMSKIRGGSPSTGGKLYQFDLENLDEPPYLVYNVSETSSRLAFGLRRGPDNKIYFLHHNHAGINRYISVINEPNELGAACGFSAEEIDMEINLGNTYLFPKFNSYVNTLPVLSDSIVNYDSVGGEDTLFIDPLGDIEDTEGDGLSFSILDAYNGTAFIIGDSIQFVPSVSDSGWVQVLYCDDYCYSSCDTITVYFIGNNQQGQNGLSNNEQFNMIRVYPNPGNDYVNIKCELDDGVELQFIDNLGRVHAVFSLNKGDTVCNLSELKSGVYTLVFLNSKTSIIAVKRFVKIE